MPNRIIKESVCVSDTIDQMTWFEECFWYRLIVCCDDYGRMDARPAVLKARLFPLKERITLKEISAALTKLATLGCVMLYDCDSKPYLSLPAWEVHQTIRAKKSKYPSPADGVKSSEIICKHMQADESKCYRNPIQSESNSELPPLKTPQGGNRFTAPTIAEVEEYCQERNNRVSADDFVNFYTSKGWKVGQSPMKDWKAAVRTWEKRGGGATKINKGKNHAQRTYTPEDFENIGKDLLEDD